MDKIFTPEKMIKSDPIIELLDLAYARINPTSPSLELVENVMRFADAYEVKLLSNGLTLSYVAN